MPGLLFPQIRSWWLLCSAAVITIGIVAASQLFTDRIGRLLDIQAAELLAADLVIDSSLPLPAYIRQSAEDAGLVSAQVIELRSAVFIDDAPQLVELKAVSDRYPLRGKLEKARDMGATAQPVERGPQPGEAWVDNKLAAQVGAALELGYSRIPVTWLLAYEPDRGGSLFNLAPRVMIHLDDLDATGLLVPGSRARYKLLLAGPPDAVSGFAEQIEPRLTESQRIQSLNNARPEMRRALERTETFFSLSIIMTLVIAMVAIAITARYSATREATKVSVMRSFGISSRRLARYFLAQIFKVWLWALIPGLLLGLAAQYPLQWALGFWFGSSLPAATLEPFVLAAIVGLVSLVGFCIPPLLRVIDSPPMRVLRDMNLGGADRRSWLIIVPSLATLLLVLVLIVPQLNMALLLFAVILVIALVVPAVLRLLIALYARFGRGRFWLKFYLLSRLNSPGRNAWFVMSGFSLTLLAVLLISQVKDRLIGDWEASLPEDIPNYFMINIATADVERLSAFLRDKGIESSNPYAMVRARLQRLNGVDVKNVEFPSDRGEWLRTHTFNISYTSELPEDNQIIAGEWIGQQTSGDEFSVEADIAKDMGLEPGDRLTFAVGADEFTGRVSSIRSVVWENFKPNFFVLGSRAQLADKPQTWLLSARIEDEQKQWLKPLIRQFPSVTLLDISEVISRVKAIIERASIALQFFFGFAIVAAFIVLVSALNTANPDRQREIALLVALGANRGQKVSSQAWEFILMGTLVGVFAALFATLVANLVAIVFFDLEFVLQPLMWVISLLVAVMSITVFGLALIYRGFEVSPMKLLRS